MFESTLEAQALHESDRRFGTLSAAAFAHLVLGVAIVAVTAIIVPPVHPPDAPSPLIVIVPEIHLDDVAPRPIHPPAPTKGTGAPKPELIVAPPRVTPDAPPRTTPDLPLASPPDTALPGPDATGDGTPGDRDGHDSGAEGGTGHDQAGRGEVNAVDPLFLTGDMVRPALLVKVDPSYPQAARRAGLGGRVTLRAVIAEDGSVDAVEVFASTNPLFDEAAVDAVRKWRYRPALMNGRPVRVYFSVVVNFLVR